MNFFDFGTKHMLCLINVLLGAVAMGIYLADKVLIPEWLLYGMALIAVFATGWIVWKQRDSMGVILVVLFVVLGYMRAVHDAALPSNDIQSAIGQSLSIVGRVADTPVIKTKDDGTMLARYYVEIDEAHRRKKSIAISGNLLVYAQAKTIGELARYGDRLTITGDVKALHGYRNPGRIDSEASWQRRGITARMYAEKVAVAKDDAWYLQKFMDDLRLRLLKAMQTVMPESDAAALFAMLFGGYGGIRPELLEAFTATGIVHILSVSGSHIALLAGAVHYLGQLCRLRAPLIAVAVVVIVLAYSAFSGFVPPVIRSATMGILSFGAVALGRESDGKRILTMTCMAMLLITPQLLFDISFQLSFGATAGLIYLVRSLQQKMQVLPKWMAVNLAITIAAQISVLPVLAWYFNSVSISSLLANFIVVPIVECIIIIGIIGSIVGIIVPFLQNLLFVVCSLGMGLVYNITSSIAMIPYGNMYIPSMSMVIGFGYYILLGCWIGLPRAYCSKVYIYLARPLVWGTMLLCVSGVGIVLLLRTPVMRVHFIDVGQGDAALIVTPRGKAVLVDTGGVLQSKSDFDVGARVVVPYLKHYGVTELEYLILTHAHDDHAGGTYAVYKKIPVTHVVTGAEGALAYARFFRTSPANLPLCIVARHGQQFVVDSVMFTLLVPEVSVKGRSGNEASNVVRVEYGSHSFLLTGDLTAEGEASLMKAGAMLKSTVLKVAHHGSKTSSVKAFLAAVEPEFAVISVGADNSFGHPNGEVIERLAEEKALINRTDQEGAIVFTTDGKNLQRMSFMEGR